MCSSQDLKSSVCVSHYFFDSIHVSAGRRLRRSWTRNILSSELFQVLDSLQRESACGRQRLVNTTTGIFLKSTLSLTEFEDCEAGCHCFKGIEPGP